MNKNVLIVCMCMSIITTTYAMDTSHPQLSVGRALDNGSLIRNNKRTGNKIVMQRTCDDKEFIIYRANNYVLPPLAIGTGILSMACVITMNPTMIITTAVSGSLLFTSGFIKLAQAAEDTCKKCKPSDDDIV